MINYEKLSWENFLSTGNDGYEIDLSGHKLTLIRGPNGAGKSTMIDAFCFALFNRAYRDITKPQMINSINTKNCKVTLDFNKNGVNYRIFRGIKPNLFEIYRDNVLIPPPKRADDYQKLLEEEILMTNYKTMTQVDILGSAKYVPFMELKTLDRRMIVEDLLSISIISVMAKLAKEKRDEHNRNVSDARTHQREVKGFLDSLLEQQKVIDKNRNEKKTFIRKELEEIKVRYLANENGIKKNKEALSDVMVEVKALPPYDKCVEKKRVYREKITIANTKLNYIRSMLDKLDSQDFCTVCQQPVNEDHKASVHSDNDGEIVILEKEIKLSRERAELVSSIIDDHDKLSIEAANIKDSINVNLRIKENFDNEIKHLLSSLEDKNDEVDNTSLIEVKTLDYNEVSTQLIDFEQQSEINMIIQNLLKDDGFKARMIDAFVPKINNYINEFLERMDLYCSFEFDNQFNEIIKSRYRDAFTYSSFSEGEKMKINLAILFAWRKIAQERGSLSSNVLILDEVIDSSMDTTSSEEFLRIIREVSEAQSVFVISHRATADMGFTKTINVTKVNDFSRYTIE